MLWLSETRLRITIHWVFLFERLLILICDFYKNNVFFFKFKVFVYTFLFLFFVCVWLANQLYKKKFLKSSKNLRKLLYCSQ